MTDRQILWRVELPLAMPGDHRRAADRDGVSTVAIATLAIFARAGGLGEPDLRSSNLSFPTNIIIAAAIAIVMALALRPRRWSWCSGWPLRGGGEDAVTASPRRSSTHSGARSNSSSSSASRHQAGTWSAGSTRLELALTQLEVTAVALGWSIAIALPVGLLLGHRGRGEFFAVGFGNAGRAIPELAVIASCSRR